MEAREFYNHVHDSWYNIRHWSLFQDDLERINDRWEGGKLLNIGCAHGPDFMPFSSDFELYGIDISQNLLDKGRKFSGKLGKEPYLAASDMRKLPFKDGAFENIISIASLHHILSREERIEALKEMKRVLKKDGEAFITVWNKWKPQFLFKDKVIEKEWNYKGKVLKRSYYLYTYRELKKDFEKSGFEVIEMRPESWYNLPLKYFSENILALVK